MSFVQEKRGIKMINLALIFVVMLKFAAVIKTASGGETEKTENSTSLLVNVKTVKAEANRLYQYELNQNMEFIFHFHPNRESSRNISLSGGIRIQSSGGNDMEYPIFFTVKRQTQTISWMLPVTSSSGGTIIRNASRTLCESYPTEQNEEDHVIHINVYTSSPINATFSLEFVVEMGTDLVLGESYTLEIDEMSPQVFKYVFGENTPEFLQLKVESEDFICMTVSVQNFSCPIGDQESTVQFSGYWQTMTRKAGMTLSRDAIQGARGYYIVFVVHEDDSRCQNNVDQVNRDRRKRVKFSLTKTLASTDYLWTIFVTIISLIAFCGAFILLNRHINKVKVNMEWLDGTVSREACYIARNPLEISSIISPSSAAELSNAQESAKVASAEVEVECAAETINEPFVSWKKGKKKSVRITIPNRESTIVGATHMSSTEADVFSIDVNEDDVELKDRITKGSLRFRFSIGGEMYSVSQLAQKDDGERSKEIRGFVWGLLTVAVFYSLPVVQLGLLYLRLYHSTGNQDLCYYNYLCARPLWRFQDFNHIFSNIGYVMLGLLFIILTRCTSQRCLRARLACKEIEMCGIPRHFGLFYSLGGGLVAEGVLSASYHVCPTRENIQFDMCFMYVTGILCFLKMYQTRHQDISATSHVFYAGLAFITFISVLAMVIQSDAFWVPFTIFYLLVSFAANLRVYYVRQLKFRYTMLARETVRRIFQENVRSHFAKDGRGRLRPKRIIRLVTLVLSVFLNLAVAIYSYHSRANVGFNLLSAFMANFLLYIGFYIVMKKMHGETVLLEPSLYGVCVLIFCTSALCTFVQETISWALTPAESRSLNSDCILFGFYDAHDVWHFLSAAGVFFSFMLLLTLDNDVARVPRSKLAVF